MISPRPDSVSVTIYRDLFALVTETRTVDLPEGPVTLEFDGVVDTLIPQSAVIAGTQRAVAEILAIVAAFFFALAATLQQKGALGMGEVSLGSPSSFLTLVKQPWWLAGTIAPGFHVGGFWNAFFGAIIVSLVSWVLSAFFQNSDGQYRVITSHSQIKQVRGRVVE